MRAISLLLLIAFLSACVNSGVGFGFPVFEGETHADTKLKKDVLSNVMLFSPVMGCSEFELVKTSVVSPPSGEIGKEKVTEKWVLYGCSQSFPFIVKLTGDGLGGSYIALERDF